MGRGDRMASELQSVYESAVAHVQADTNTIQRVNAVGHHVVATSDDGTRVVYAVDVAVEGDCHYIVHVVATVGAWAGLKAST